MNRYFFGLDLGQAQDYSALSIVEWAWTPKRVPSHFYQGRPIGYKEGRAFKEYRLRHLERFPLGTPYHEIAEKVKRLQGQVEQRGQARTHVAVDKTGVGAPVVEMLTKAGVKNL